jgi:energy-converting hydrogenase Eha subunit C
VKVTKRYNLVQGKIRLDNYLDIYQSSQLLRVITVILNFGYMMGFNKCRPIGRGMIVVKGICQLTKFTFIA